MKANAKSALTITLSVLVIAAACVWIYFSTHRQQKINQALHQRIGEVLAEETSKLIGPKGKVVTIAIETREWPELKVQLDAFDQTLKKLGNYEIREYLMDTKDQPKYGIGTGLSGRRFVRTVKKNENAEVVVSFIGAPNLDAEEIAELEKMPKFIASARSPDNLPALFAHKLIQVAVVARFKFPSPGTDHPKTGAEWFTKRYQIVTPENAKLLPKPPEGQ